MAQLGQPVLVTGQDLKTLTEIHVKKSKVSVKQVIYEPKAKNTGPAVLVACQWLKMMGLENESAGFFPADHLIQDEQEFLSATRNAKIRMNEQLVGYPIENYLLFHLCWALYFFEANKN